MTSIRRRPALRWLAPVLVALVFVGAGSVVSAIRNAAQAGLSPRSAAQLLVDVQNARVTGLSGTVVQKADLGLPALPQLGGSSSSDLTALVSGTHTLRLWYAGPERARLALLGQFGESDLIRNGKDVWSWSSSQRSATHWTLPSGAKAPDPARVPNTGSTPQEAADAALEAISPTTKVTTNGTAIVAGRKAYLLTLQPRTAQTLVDSVQIAIDGKTHVPTRVQVYAKGKEDPAFEVGFTSFVPSTPPASVFAFNPPPGTKVTQHRATTPERNPAGQPAQTGKADSGANGASGAHTGKSAAPKTVGSGWSSVLVATAPDLTSGKAGDNPLGGTLTKLPRVSGAWGSGRLLAGTLFSVLLTDDGRVVVGAVPPAQLYAALTAP